MSGETEQTPVVLSYGMGWDSTSILLRWMEDSSSRDFDLQDVVVLSAQTGLEFLDTKRLVERHVLPRLRAHAVRYVQVSRAGPSVRDGIVVLSDTKRSTECHIEGSYTLADELLAAGTVPQYASGKRRCTLKAKGQVLDTWLAQEFGGMPFRHVMGFNADETRRVERDRAYSNAVRMSEYPLVDWNHGREAVEEHVTSVIREPFARSCCTICPFAGGKAPMLRRYRAFPEAGAFAIFLEHVSLALNPRMTLYSGGKTVREAIAHDGNVEALHLAEQMLDDCEWGLYHVQRIYYARGTAHRKVTAVERGGSRREMIGLLYQHGDREREVTGAGIPRLYVIRRGDTYPTREEFYVAAPAVVEDKCRSSFDKRWRKLACPQMKLVQQLQFEFKVGNHKTGR